MKNFSLSDFENIASIVSLITGIVLGVAGSITFKICGNNDTRVNGDNNKMLDNSHVVGDVVFGDKKGNEEK